jgi:hypothetical protein
MHRLRDFPLAPEGAANRFDPGATAVAVVEDEFLARVLDVLRDPDVVDAVRAELRALRDEWGDLAHQALVYGWRHPFPQENPPPSEVLMQPAEGGPFGHWRVPGSLREVEDPSLIYLKGVRAPGG